MNAAQMTHIFWKEYRTQRSLWVAVVLLFLVTTVLTVLFLPEQYAPDVNSLLTSGFVTVTFYLLASTSILYASEKEQQTDVFLRTLPTNPWLMLSVKSAWVVLSSLVAIGIFSFAAYLLGKPGHVAGFDLRFTVCLLAYLFGCSLAVSFCTRHVLSAIGLSVGLIFAFPILGETLRSRFFSQIDSFEYTYFTIVTIILLAATLELNRRWFRESDWTWRAGIRLGRAMTLQSALALPVEADGSGRVWRRYLWREWKSLRSWLIGNSAFAILLTTWWYPNPTAIELRLLLFAITLVIIPLLFGVGSCNGDQTYERFLFLGNRGASSSRLLLAKHTLWICGCLLLILAFRWYFWPDYLTLISNRHEEVGFTAGLRFVPISADLLSSARVEQLSGSLIPGIRFCAGIVLLLYCLGHFFSLLIRQPVLSLLTALFSGVFVVTLVCLFYAFDVPLFVLTVAPAICLLGLSFYRGRDWIIGDRSATSWKRLALWSLLGVWTLISLLAAWRVAEIPFTTVIDLSGLNNIPTHYFAGIASGILTTLLVLLLADGFRWNFRDSSGRQIFGTRKWCTLAGVVGTFLVGHNLLLLAGSVFYSQHVSMLATPMRQAVRNDLSDRREFDNSGGDLYQSADEKINSALPLPGESLQDAQHQAHGSDDLRRMRVNYQWSSWSDVTEEQRTWLEQNQDVLPLFFAADRAGVVESKLVRAQITGTSVKFFAAPFNFLVNAENGTSLDLIPLVRLQALKLEHEGKLDDAWKHHIAVVRYARRFADDNFPSARREALNWLNTVMFSGDLWRWQARKEQTPERLARAAEDLRRELTQLSPLAESYERLGGWTLEFLDNLSTFQLIAEDELLAALPWERQRLRTLIVDAMRQHAQLADNIDEGLVSTNRLYQFDHLDREYYLRNRDWQMTGIDHVITLSRKRGEKLPGLLVEFQKSSSTTLGLKDRVIQLPDVLQSAETTPLLMVAPKHIFSLIDRPVADTLFDELNFWNALDEWIGNCAIYSYRAETGAFPLYLNELNDSKKTPELFTPLIVAKPGVERGAPWTFSQRVQTYGNTWNHAAKWPQPEYNMGDTPDRKPRSPRQTPQPEEVQP